MTLTAEVVAHRGQWTLAGSFEASRGDVIAVVGPNGSGKSTLLQVIAGLVPLTKGRIQLGSDCYDDPAQGIYRPPSDRDVAVCFQDSRLFGHLTVLDNVAFADRCRGRSAKESRVRAQAILRRWQLEEFATRRPDELSGGQQRLVAIARTLAKDATVVLLDEPTANLDRDITGFARKMLAEELVQRNSVVLLVSHDSADVTHLADRTIEIEGGQMNVSPMRIANPHVFPRLAVILAGGTSKRMGGNDKLTITIAGRPLLDHAIDAVPDSTEVVVVGPQRPTARNVTWTQEQPTGGGPVAGIAAGLAAAQSASDNDELVAVIAGDMPFAQAGLQRLAEAFDSSTSEVVIAVDEQGRDQPLLAVWRRRSLEAAIRRCQSPVGISARALFVGVEVSRVRLADASTWDCDEPADIARVESLIRDQEVN